MPSPALQLVSISIICLFGVVLSQVPNGEPMKFETPKMTEEEQHSVHIPSNLMCDACQAVSYQISSALAKAESKKHGKKLKESEYLDLFESVCTGKAWDDYGIKSIAGVNRISGPGLAASDSPGMMQGGGKWPSRLMMKCSGFLGEIGEDEIYDEYRNSNDLETFFCKKLTKDCVKKKKAKKEL